MPIGKYGKKHSSFTDKCFGINNNDSIYIFSDGYVDQFGGDKDKKIGSTRLQNLILNHYPKPMDVQGLIYDSEFEKWKGDKEQTDDMLFIGLKPPFKKNANYKVSNIQEFASMQ